MFTNSFIITTVIGYIINYTMFWRFLYETIITNTIHTQSIISVFIILFGSLGLNCFLYFIWYKWKRNEYKIWRNQPSKIDLHERHKYHIYIYINNFIMAFICCGWSTELIIRYKLYLTPRNDDIIYIVLMFIVSIMYESIMEYYWHRIMHLPWFYQTFHKLHHYYKSPQPFDDLIVHPLENFGYYLIMYSPPFIMYPYLPIYSFILYMIYIGLTGVLDHSGIYLEIPFIYNTKEHDFHHKLFNCNYSFPHPFMDYIHGTHHSQQQIHYLKRK